MGNPDKETVKKPYSTPKLTNYGTIRELTQHVGVKGKRDGPPHPPQRTHL
jgi:hypothetical protein